MSSLITESPYVVTFRKHQRLLIAPIVIALVIALWVVVGSPRTYVATANVWTEQTIQTDPAPTLPVDPTLRNSALGQQVLQELLSTRNFRLAVGHRGPLSAYLAHHASEGLAPTALLARLRGSASLDNRIVAALGRGRVLMAVSGPDVLSIAYRGPTESVATGTLRALINEFIEQDAANRRIQDHATSKYFQGLVASANKNLGAAQHALSQYLADHPTNGQADAGVGPLTQAVTDAQSQLADATDSYNRAQRAVLANTPKYRVIDPPRLTGTSGGKAKALSALGVGLVLGLVVSLLGLAALVSLARRTSTAAGVPAALDPTGDASLPRSEPLPATATASKWNGDGGDAVPANGSGTNGRGVPVLSRPSPPDGAGAPVKPMANAKTFDGNEPANGANGNVVDHVHAPRTSGTPAKSRGKQPAVAARRKTRSTAPASARAAADSSDTRPGRKP